MEKLSTIITRIKIKEKWHPISLFHSYCSFSVLFKGSFFACFSLKISPIAPRVPSVSIALDGIKTLFAGPFATSANDSNDL